MDSWSPQKPSKRVPVKNIRVCVLVRGFSMGCFQENQKKPDVATRFLWPRSPRLDPNKAYWGKPGEQRGSTHFPAPYRRLCFGQSIPLVVERIGPQKTNKIPSPVLAVPGRALFVLFYFCCLLGLFFFSSSAGLGVRFNSLSSQLFFKGSPFVTFVKILFACETCFGL